MTPEAEQLRAIQAEFERLGLDRRDLPGGGLAGTLDGMRQLLERLRGMSPGVTWREVFPDLPAHWMPGRPETWTRPYRPFGPYDYQELPTGPVAHVVWDRPGAPDQLERLLASAREAGWPIHGAGLIPVSNPAWTTVMALIVLERGTTEEQFAEFSDWLESVPEVRFAGSPRSGTETYLT